MILKILSETKLASMNKIEEELNKISTINSIQELLNEIDFEAEIVQLNDADKLKSLLSSLKGAALTKDEIKIAEQISQQN